MNTAPSPESQALERASQAVLVTRARSFRWGQALLPTEAAREVALCYAFCRLVDDTADEAADIDTARTALDDIVGELMGERPARPIVLAYKDIVRRRGIDPRAAQELLAGMRFDLETVRVEDDAELLRYAYRVAGTVGVMMCGILGVDERAALPHAIDLGIAMQLSNIARDVREDAARGRVYLPRTRLLAAGVTPESVVDGSADPARVHAVVVDLVSLAERYYESAARGMRFIPWRARAAILVAMRLYRAIGWRVVKGGARALETRAVVPPSQKLVLAVRAIGEWIDTCLSPATERASSRHASELHASLRGLPGVAAH